MDIFQRCRYWWSVVAAVLSTYPYRATLVTVEITRWLLMAWYLFGTGSSAVILTTYADHRISGWTDMTACAVPYETNIDFIYAMMTSSNGNIFRVTGPLCGEFTGHPWITRTKASFDVFFHLRLNKRLSKQSWGWWFETPSRPLWRHCTGCDLWYHIFALRRSPSR